MTLKIIIIWLLTTGSERNMIRVVIDYHYQLRK